MTRTLTAILIAAVALVAAGAYWLTHTSPAGASPAAVDAATARAHTTVETAAANLDFPLTVPADINYAPLCDRFTWAMNYGFDSTTAYHLTVSEAVLRLRAGVGEEQRTIATALITDLYGPGGLCGALL